MKQRISAILFDRRKESKKDNYKGRIILHLDKEIPSMGYSPGELRKLLKKYDNEG